MKHRLVKNALSNLTRGGAAAVVALLLPPGPGPSHAAASYAVWVLALQAAAVIPMEEFLCLQLARTRTLNRACI